MLGGMTRSLFAFCLTGALAACGSGSAASHDGGRDARGAHDAMPDGTYLTGTLTNASDPCLTAKIVSPGGDPACTMVEHIPTDAGTVMDVPVPSCLDSNLAPPCFAVNSMTSCPMIFNVNTSVGTPSTATFSYSCLLCPTTGPQPDGC